MPDATPGGRVDRVRELVADVVAWRLSARVVVALVVTALVAGTLPFTLGAVGADPVDTGDRPTARAVEDPRQRHQNAVASDAIDTGPWALLFVALAGSFVAATRSSEPRKRVVGSVALGVPAGTVVGYVALVALAHLAYAPTANGYLVRSAPVVFRAWATAGNAVGLAVPATVGSALVAASGTLADRSDDAPDRVDGTLDDADEAPEADALGDDRATGDDTPTDEAAEANTAERPDSVAVDATGPAGAPAYDPEERDWDGSDDT